MIKEVVTIAIAIASLLISLMLCYIHIEKSNKEKSKEKDDHQLLLEVSAEARDKARTIKSLHYMIEADKKYSKETFNEMLKKINRLEKELSELKKKK